LAWTFGGKLNNAKKQANWTVSSLTDLAISSMSKPAAVVLTRHDFHGLLICDGGSLILVNLWHLLTCNIENWRKEWNTVD